MNINATPYATDHKPKDSWAGIVFGLWIGGIYLGSIGGRLLVQGEREDTIIHIVVLIVAILWPLLYFVFSRHGFLPRGIRGSSLLALLVFFLFCFLSSFVSPIAFNSAAFVALTLVSVWLSLQFGSAMNTRQLESGLKIYALIITVVLAGFAWDDYTPGLRLGNGKGILNPNSVGVVSVSAALAAMAFRSWLIRYLLVGIIFVIIYLSGSRASAMGTLIGLGIIGYQRTRLAGTGIKVIVLSILIISAIAMAAYWASTESAISDFLQLKARDRGLGSGATGRVIAWSQTWQLFLGSPLLGIGFRAHEHILGVSSHNGYLATLAEIGLPGFIAIMYLIFTGAYRLWRITQKAELVYNYTILFGLICGYLFIAIFERFLINVGNPTSLLFMVGIILPMIKDRKIPLAAQPYRPLGSLYDHSLLGKP